MDPKMKARWIEALRSSKYAQTKGVLNRTKPASDDRPVGFCCLGVLCDVFAQENRDAKWIPYLPGQLGLEYRGERHGGGLPFTVQDAVGLKDGDEIHLIEMNDNEDKGKTFDEIADWIEENL